MKNILFFIFGCLLFYSAASAQNKPLFKQSFIYPCVFKGVNNINGDLDVLTINGQKLNEQLTIPVSGEDQHLNKANVLGVCYAVSINYSEKVEYFDATILNDFAPEKEKELLKKLFIYYNQQGILILKQSIILLKSVQNPSDWGKSQFSDLLVTYMKQHMMWIVAESSIPFDISYEFMKELKDTVIKEYVEASDEYDKEWKRLGYPGLE